MADKKIPENIPTPKEDWFDKKLIPKNLEMNRLLKKKKLEQLYRKRAGIKEIVKMIEISKQEREKEIKQTLTELEDIYKSIEVYINEHPEAKTKNLIKEVKI